MKLVQTTKEGFSQSWMPLRGEGKTNGSAVPTMGALPCRTRAFVGEAMLLQKMMLSECVEWVCEIPTQV